MFNIKVWCVFFVIFPCNYCGEENLFAIDIYEHVDGQRQTKAVCNVTQKDIVIKKGENIGFNVTSQKSINSGICTWSNNNSEMSIKLIRENGNNSGNIFKSNATMVSGKWSCEFYYSHDVQSNVRPVKTLPDGLSYTVSVCDNMKITLKEPWYCDDTCIILTGSLLSLLVIIISVLLGLAIYYKRKSKTIHNLETLSAMPRQTNDRARYSKPPLKKPLITVETERDSCIYEALDALQLEVSPDTSIATLPLPAKPLQQADDTPSSSTSDINIIKETKKKNKTKEKKGKKENKKMSPPVMAASKTDGEVKIRTFMFGKSKAKRKADTKDKRTTIERIRDRLPLPLPEAESGSSSDEYHDISPTLPMRTPENAKREFKPPKNKLPMPTKAQDTLTKPVPPPPIQKKPMKSEPAPAVTPKPFIPPAKPNVNTVSELENVLKKKGLGNPASPTRPKGTLPKQPPEPKPGPTESVVIPRPKGTLPKPSLPAPPVSTKPAKPVPLTSKKPSMPKLPQPTPAATLRPIKSPPMDAPVPPPISTLPRANKKNPAENPAPAGTPRPSRPKPMDAPVPPPISTLPRPTPVAPVEEPEDLTDDNGWEGEDWEYEPLPAYNIYSM